MDYNIIIDENKNEDFYDFLRKSIRKYNDKISTAGKLEDYPPGSIYYWMSKKLESVDEIV